MKPTASLRSFLLTCFVATLALSTADGQSYTAGQTNWTGTGSTNGSWTGSGWSTATPATGGTYAIRINLNNGSNPTLIYSAAQDYTIYTGDGTTNRALGSSTGSNGSMTLTGGTFDSRGTAQDFLGPNGNGTKTLTINGGSYINTNGGSSQFLMAYEGSGSKGILNMQDGNFTVGSIGFSRGTDKTGNGEINLNGGILQTGSFAGSTSADTKIYFNGGTLRAGANSTNYIATAINTTAVKSRGAVIDTNGFNITIGRSLTEDSGSAGGGLTLNDQSVSGGGTLTLSASNNSYTGATTVTRGTLALVSTGSIATSSTIHVASGAHLNVSAVTGGWTVGASQTLTGDGTVTGTTTFNDGSIFGWNLGVQNPNSTSSTSIGDTLAVSGNLGDGGTAGGSVFKILLADSQSFSDTFWNANHSWTNVLTSSNSFDLQNLFTSFNYANANGAISGPTQGSFSLSGSTLTYTYSVIPEPTTALAGLLLGAGLLRRRRGSV